MGAQRYQKIPEQDTQAISFNEQHQAAPTSPPPSFRSRASSLSSQRHILHGEQMTRVDQTLADTFDGGHASDDDGDDRQRLMRGGHPAQEDSENDTIDRIHRSGPQSSSATLASRPVFTSTYVRAIPHTALSSSNDGVFANLNAKPERGEKIEEQPPTYEQAAADAAPPYWETTILTPGVVSDEVYVDGLPVGSLFSFVWNGIISMSFQLVGFLLTYLLHTTHAAKNGSRAGLGITLVRYGFYMKSISSSRRGNTEPQYGQPPDPNSHDFDPSTVADSAAAAIAAMAKTEAEPGGGVRGQGLIASEWIAYALMIIGWYVLIKSVTDFIKARRHEQLVLQSPDRGLNVPVVADGETTATVV